ncbi:MAG: permease YjgP/YjgQ family protein [Bacteroidetes bacterium]|nr:permease YjgP/YjgQ family protein [Bacteroidota bacterium]
MLLLPRYILRAHVGPFFFSLITLMFVFLLQFVMKFIDQLVGKGLTAWVIIELIALSLSWMLVLAVPMSVLVAILMAFGDLSSRNEITAMKAGGVSIYRMMAPVFIAGVCVALIMVWFNNSVLPETNHRLKALTTDIRRKKPTIAFVNGVFSQDLPGYSILVRKTSETSNDLTGVTLYDYSNPTKNILITAERGTISFSPDYRKIIMLLHVGEIHELDLQEMKTYRKVRFDQHRIAMDVEGFEFERSATSAFTRGDRELSAPAMMKVVDSLEVLLARQREEMRAMMKKEMEGTVRGEWMRTVSADGMTMAPDAASALIKARTVAANLSTAGFRIDALEKQVNQYWVEIHKKYAMPVACIVFVLVGAPIGIMSRKGGFGIAATLSLGFFIVYWAFLIGGEKLADRAILSPFWGMWGANILIGAMGVYLTSRVGREAILINWSVFERLIPRRWRTVLPDDPSTASSPV